MNSEELKALQAPIKAGYKDNPQSALVTMSVTGTVNGQDLTCSVPTQAGTAVAGLHPAAGGDGTHACSGDMLLESLVACVGVTLRAVATAMDIPITGGSIQAEGTMDFRGTLGVSRDVPIGMSIVQLTFDLDSPAPAEQVAKLVELTERYCVIYQTLQKPPQLESHLRQ